MVDVKIFLGASTKIYDYGEFDFIENLNEYLKGITKMFCTENRYLHFEIGSFKTLYPLDPDIYNIWEDFYYVLEYIFNKEKVVLFLTYTEDLYEFIENNESLYCEFKGGGEIWTKEINKEQFTNELISFMTKIHYEAINKGYFTVEDAISYIEFQLGRSHSFNDKEIQKEVLDRLITPLKGLNLDA